MAALLSRFRRTPSYPVTALAVLPEHPRAIHLVFSEGTLAAAYINGVQSTGVAATIKHFVANDQEHERTAVSSEESERALKEIYLCPYDTYNLDFILLTHAWFLQDFTWHKGYQLLGLT